jgi:hypothetical protein
MEEAQAKLDRKRELSRLRSQKYYEKKKADISERRKENYKVTAEAEGRQINKIIIPEKKKVKRRLKIVLQDNDGSVIDETDAITSKVNLSDKSKLNYMAQYRKITAMLHRDIYSTPNRDIIKVFEENITNPSTKYTYINIPIIIKKHFGDEPEELTDYRDKLVKEKSKHTNELLEQKDDSLPSYETLLREFKNINIEQNPIAFVINYLFMTYGVRNKDVDVFVTNAGKDLNENLNYLLVKKNEVEWRVNDYKTLQAYGPKKFIIRSKKFIDAVKSIPNNTWLLNDNGNHLADSSLSHAIKRHTINGLGQGDIFKILIKHIRTKPNFKDLLENLSSSRGTDVQKILEYYTTGKQGASLADELE